MKKTFLSSTAARLSVAAASVMLTLLAFVLVTNACIDRSAARTDAPAANRNDRYLEWLLADDPVFVPGPRQGARETSPGLRWLDNGYDSFSAVKSSGTFRIFCVGGSTTRGWPFHAVVSYPRLLDLYLRDVLPGRRVEVINAGFMSFDSARDIGVVKDVLAYEPDLVLVYEGRNELHQRPLRASHLSWIVKAHVWLLRNVRLYAARRRALPDTFDQAGTTREFLAAHTAQSAAALRGDFARNLAAIADLCARRGCAVAVLTQVVHPGEEESPVSMHAYNEWLREFARSRGIILIDVDRAFRGSALPADELVLPGIAVHPELKGYALMARTVCRVLGETSLIAPPGEWRWRGLGNDGRYFRALGVNAPFMSETYGKLADLFTTAGELEAGKRYRAIAARYAAGKEAF